VVYRTGQLHVQIGQLSVWSLLIGIGFNGIPSKGQRAAGQRRGVVVLPRRNRLDLREANFSYVKVLLWHLPADTEENHENHQPGCPI
jgi:hypothetical protein